MLKNIIALLILNVSPAICQAGFLRLVPSVQMAASETVPGAIDLSGSIENQGDEAAYGVMIEYVRGGKLLAEVGELAAGEKKDVSLTVQARELGLDKEGYFILPMRVLYKDANKVPFSAAFILTYSQKSENGVMGRSSPVTIGLEPEFQSNGTVEVGGSGSFGLTVSNTSTAPVAIVLEFLGTKEIELKVDETEIKLGPQEEKLIKVRSRNINALQGSSYATYAIISGQIDGQNFSDYAGFLINVTSAAGFPWPAYAFALLAVLFGYLGFKRVRRESPKVAEIGDTLSARTTPELPPESGDTKADQ